MATSCSSAVRCSELVSAAKTEEIRRHLNTDASWLPSPQILAFSSFFALPLDNFLRPGHASSVMESVWRARTHRSRPDLMGAA